MRRWFGSPGQGSTLAARSADASADRLSRLESITEAALSHLALDELLDALLTRIRDLLDVETASVLLRFGDVLTPTASRGFEEEVGVGIQIPIGRGFAGTIAAEERPLLVEDASEIEVINPLMRVRGLRSLLGVPLLHRGAVIGVVHVGTTQPRSFTPDDVITLQLAADRVAMAISQARLFEAEREARAEAESGQRRLRFLAEASEVLSSSLDVEAALQRVAQLCVPTVADSCVVDVVRGDGSLERVAEAPPAPGQAGSLDVPSVIESGESLLRNAHQRSYLSVPLLARGRVLGAISFVSSESERIFGPESLAFAQEIARRTATAIENATLYAEAEQRSRAALALAHIGEGVFLLDEFGVVHLWNPAAESITGLRADDLIGLRAADVIPGWSRIADNIPVTEFTDSTVLHGETLPLDVAGRELWILISGASFPEGTVYAFRDVTQERALRDLQAEFVATVSHELRTPLAAVYGAAMTLRDRGETLKDDDRERLFEVVYDEAARLNRIVDDILWASKLDSGRLDFAADRFVPDIIAEAVLAAARAHAPGHVSFELTRPPSLPPVAADADKVRQILSNLVDNAVKYSPDGGRVEVSIEQDDDTVRFAVSDEGIGIPTHEQPLVFERFYRLDPNQTRGVGGTGLGLYICRELTRRMNGRIWVTSAEGEGSTFFVELPLAQEDAAADVFAHFTRRG
jgi:PAS domain S-box-containing protein